MNSTADIAAKAIGTDNCDKNTLASSELKLYPEQQVRAVVSRDWRCDSWRQEIAPEHRVIRTPQRKANYKDKARPRLKDLKRTAFAEYGCSSSAQIKQYLKFLGIRLDLRLSAAWDALVFELQDEILAAKAMLEVIAARKIEDGVQTMFKAMKEAIALNDWNIVKRELASHAEDKVQAWKMLNAHEKKQLSALVPEPVKLLTKAKRNGAIASFKEDPCGLIYWVWRSADDKPELVTSCFAKTFVRNLVASSFLDAA